MILRQNQERLWQEISAHSIVGDSYYENQETAQLDPAQ